MIFYWSFLECRLLCWSEKLLFVNWRLIGANFKLIDFSEIKFKRFSFNPHAFEIKPIKPATHRVKNAFKSLFKCVYPKTMFVHANIYTFLIVHGPKVDKAARQRKSVCIQAELKIYWLFTFKYRFQHFSTGNACNSLENRWNIANENL